ncbi:von Willebrand factor A domain-containing protein 5B1 [Bagarius yarrelli]|uniref:von Willebrand factor A domain-containing protein 5B1 n=1 Tax=Bagarius yarrelli TaxID=175774 RepID=A0A556V4V6_BAGYA|nr:von Willebrand factor A domain-containing protein 5B1 [Bagarius yarrelli]
MKQNEGVQEVGLVLIPVKFTHRRLSVTTSTAMDRYMVWRHGGQDLWHHKAFIKQISLASWLLDGEDSVLGQKTLARAALAGRSFSSPQGELDMHRLRKALERFSFQQAVGGSLEECYTETHNIPEGALCLTDSNGFLCPASPLDWDGFTDSESIFADTPVPCRAVIHGLLGSKPMSWEVSLDLCVLWSPEETPRDIWNELVHHLAARSIIRDFEFMAERKTDIEHGLSKRYRIKAIQTSKSCGIISMYTTFSSTLDVSFQRMFSGTTDIRHMGVGPGSPSAASARSQCSVETRSMEMFFSSRFNLGRLKSVHSSGGQTPLKPQCLFAEPETQTESQTPDYLPLLCLQLPSGAFLLSESFSECIHIPLDRLKRASPYTIHRNSLSPSYHCGASSSPHPIAFDKTENQSITRSLDQPNSIDPFHVLPEPFSSVKGSVVMMDGHLQTKTRHGSETGKCEAAEKQEELANLDLESSSWATSVALAWLEHHCAGFFVEWELVAAKADFWLKRQSLPEGVDLPGLKAAARQLFLLLRHWNENLQLNMLCYNPNYM